MLEDIILFFGGTAAFLLAATWLTQSIVKHLLSKDIENYKQKISSESLAEIERLRHSLRLVAATHEKQTSLLQEQRAQVIAELYKLLVPFVASAEELVRRLILAGQPDKYAQVNLLHQRASAFYNFFNINRIYFSEETCQKVDQLFDGIWKSNDDLRFWLGMQQQANHEPEKLKEAWEKAGTFVQNDLRPLLGSVEKEFRGLLGVPSSQS